MATNQSLTKNNFILQMKDSLDKKVTREQEVQTPMNVKLLHGFLSKNDAINESAMDTYLGAYSDEDLQFFFLPEAIRENLNNYNKETLRIKKARKEGDFKVIGDASVSRAEAANASFYNIEKTTELLRDIYRNPGKYQKKG